MGLGNWDVFRNVRQIKLTKWFETVEYSARALSVQKGPKRCQISDVCNRLIFYAYMTTFQRVDYAPRLKITLTPLSM